MINLEIEPIIDDNKTNENKTEGKTDQPATIKIPSNAENSNPGNEDKFFTRRADNIFKEC